MLFAQIINGKVFIKISLPEAPKFSPRIMMVPCDDSVQPGWLYDGNNFTAPPAVIRQKRTTVRQVELVGLIGETAYDSIYSVAHPNQGPRNTLALFFLAIINAESTDVLSEDFQGYLSQFVAGGFISADDKARIEGGI